jgi:hypothetical protein
MLGDLRIDQRDAVRFQIAQRAFVIVAHQSAVAGDIRR